MTQGTTAAKGAAIGADAYRLLFARAGEPLLLIDADTGSIVDANDQLADLAGCSRDDLIGQPSWTLLAGAEVQGEVRGMYGCCVPHPAHRSPDMPIQRRDGSVIHVDLVCSGAWEVEGRRLLLVVVHDVTPRRAAERAAATAARRYRDLINATSEGFWHLDGDGLTLAVNDALCRMLDTTAEEMVGRSLFDFVKPADTAFVRAQFARRTNAGAGSHHVTLLASDGREVLTSFRAATLYDDDGRDVGQFALVADRTALVRREEALAKSEARLRAIIDTAVDGILTIDVRGVIQSANPAAERLSGYSARELVGRPVTILIPGPDAGRHQRYVSDYLVSGRSRIIGVGREVECRRKDGSVFPAWLSVAEVRQRDFHVFVGIIRDISQIKTYEHQLIAARQSAELANKAKSIFLANMSHELRTPLNAIFGFADLIGGKVAHLPEGEALNSYARIIRENAESLLQNISDVLEIVALETGDSRLEMSIVDIHEVLSACLRLIAKRAAAGDLRIALDVADDVPPFSGDPRALKQVVLHLLSNAVKFTPNGGSVGIAARLEGREVVIDVSDTGVGIPADRMEAIFHPFVQADSSLTRSFEGVGLGLAITKELVHRHGGTLSVRSAPGEGTTVSVRLPADLPWT